MIFHGKHLIFLKIFNVYRGFFVFFLIIFQAMADFGTMAILLRDCGEENNVHQHSK